MSHDAFVCVCMLVAYIGVGGLEKHQAQNNHSIHYHYNKNIMIVNIDWLSKETNACMQ